MTERKKIAVFFGGRSPEHDISIISGLQVLEALDARKWDAFPVYISPQGQWYIGDALRSRDNYLFTEQTRASLTPVVLDVSQQGRGVLFDTRKKFFGPAVAATFDAAIPVFHGLVGEDGGFQGLMEVAAIPYAGMRAKACAVFMDKETTKHAFAGSSVPMLPYAAIHRPAQGTLVDAAYLSSILSPIGFPCCVKPANLGSSIGVGKATTVEEARAVLANLFQYDVKALAEPFVQNLVEYNVSVRRGPDGRIETSAIERPKTSAELLNFREKYGAGGKKGGAKKLPGGSSEGMLSMTRDINPDLPAGMDEKIRAWAAAIFTRLDGTGAPRIDFIGNRETGDLWFNELNPFPGSAAYFLWEARQGGPVYFPDLLNDLIAEAFTCARSRALPHDPVPAEARMMKRG